MDSDSEDESLNIEDLGNMIEPHIDIKVEMGSDESQQNADIESDDDYLANIKRSYKLANYSEKGNNQENSDSSHNLTKTNEKDALWIEVPLQSDYSNCSKCGQIFERIKRSKKKCDDCRKHCKSRNKKRKEKTKRKRNTKKTIEYKFNEEYQCEICEKVFSKSLSLKKHMPIHTEPPGHKCDICFEVFRQAGNLLRHKMTHSDEKNFHCDICFKSFGQVAYLKKHQNIHSNAKIYVCPVCEKGFNDYSSLSKHKLIHTGLKPFSCKICFKAFNQVATLKRHQVVHTNERNYECEVCYKRFARLDRLKRHITMHVAKSEKLPDSFDPLAVDNTVKIVKNGTI